MQCVTRSPQPTLSPAAARLSDSTETAAAADEQMISWTKIPLTNEFCAPMCEDTKNAHVPFVN